MPDSPDPEARAMARNPELMAVLQEARERAKQPGGTISQEALEARDPLPPEAEAEVEALLATWRAEDADAVVEPRPTQRRRKRGRPADGYNGRLLVRVPRSVHQELAERAEAEGTTINQLVLSYVSRGLGEASTRPIGHAPSAGQSAT
ncbi:MAG: toxin-antitoxin system HicB family antitoxin [Chloroflexota bacterium]